MNSREYIAEKLGLLPEQIKIQDFEMKLTRPYNTPEPTEPPHEKEITWDDINF